MVSIIISAPVFLRRAEDRAAPPAHFEMFKAGVGVSPTIPSRFKFGEHTVYLTKENGEGGWAIDLRQEPFEISFSREEGFLLGKELEHHGYSEGRVVAVLVGSLDSPQIILKVDPRVDLEVGGGDRAYKYFKVSRL